MSIQTVITIDSGLTANGFKSQCDLSMGGLAALQNLINYFESLPDQQQALLTCDVAAVKAAGTITFASTGPTNNQTCTIAGVTFTAKTSGAGAHEFNINASATVVATNLAAAINAANGSLNGIVSATSALGVVTVTAYEAGTVGNGIDILNVDLANATFSNLAGGSDGTVYTLDMR